MINLINTGKLIPSAINISRLGSAWVGLGSFFLFSLLSAPATKATTINVSSIPALQSAINSAASGDVIVLADGTYLNNTINVGTSGITVRAATPSRVYLNSSNAITISGNRNVFSGFQFTSGSNTTLDTDVFDNVTVVP